MRTPPRDFIEIGPSPAYEKCAQTVDIDYPTRSREECHRFAAQLNTQFGPLRGALNGGDPDNFMGHFITHYNGEYREVVVFFNPDIPDSIDFAFFVEDNSPARWSDNHIFTIDEFRAYQAEH